ncbi:NAD(P)/FAD-dependent oxidoreductase [Nocardioides sp. SYSU D00038]|uniref:NAD(P)/FAD-dependent oxidoreductase n=1 Tax=Nocardioides sp. SYSU D00038 TaxID=2812554 RepID=UPI001967D76C|nr:NAD(P)/FAD-dependent oxidoreductase [Nocardioides sp. SYSU D00038]
MANTSLDYDAIVIGGGPAGLQATLTLGRVHRRVLMLDSGSYRNAPASHMHNVLTHDGTPPPQFRAAARAELTAYDTVTVRDAEATAVRRRDDDVLVVEADGEELTARGVVLATGVRDTLPDKPGLTELFGDVVAHCPFCHGHEYAGGHVAVLGNQAAGHLPGILAPVASRITVLTDGAELEAELAPGVAVRTEPVTGVCRGPAGARVSFADGPDEDVAGLYVVTSFAQSAPFAEQLGLEMLPSGCIRIDAMGRTSVPGVHAAGDLAHHPELPMPMASVLTAAAAGQVAAASLVATRLLD